MYSLGMAITIQIVGQCIGIGQARRGAWSTEVIQCLAMAFGSHQAKARKWERTMRPS